MKYLFVC